jgi:hypothetical protein
MADDDGTLEYGEQDAACANPFNMGSQNGIYRFAHVGMGRTATHRRVI